MPLAGLILATSWGLLLPGLVRRLLASPWLSWSTNRGECRHLDDRQRWLNTQSYNYSWGGLVWNGALGLRLFWALACGSKVRNDGLRAYGVWLRCFCEIDGGRA